MLLHWLATLIITLAVLASVGLAAIVWRLSQGPVDLPWLTSRLEDTLNAGGGPTRLAIGAAGLAWEGFHHGVDSPLDLRLTDVVMIDEPAGRRITIPQAEVSLSFLQLLLGRVAPRTITVDSPRLTLIRAADGTLSLDLGSLSETAGGTNLGAASTPVMDVLARLAQPPGNDRNPAGGGLLSQLRRVRVRDASVAVVDRQLGVTFHAPEANIDLQREPQGGVAGTAGVTLALGSQQTQLTASAMLAPGASHILLRTTFSPVTPKLIADAVPAFTSLAAINAPIGGEAALDLDGNLALDKAQFTLHAGAGTIRIARGYVPIQNAVLVASGSPAALDVQMLRVTLAGHSGLRTHLDLRGTMRRDAERASIAVSAGLDQMDFADLPEFWPDGVGHHARAWLLENITGGMARDGHVDLELAGLPDLSNLDLTKASGTLDGEGLQVFWLRPLPPIDDGQAQLRILDPDTLEITVQSGRQRLRSNGSLQIHSGTMQITGLLQPRQFGAIETEVSGSIPDTLTFLREPRLRLLDRRPIELKNPAGQVTAKLTATLPLEQSVRMDDVTIRAKAHLEGVHLSDVAAGQDLDQGVLDLDINADGLKLNGHALLASIPAKLDGMMDFRAGPPTQAEETVRISGQPDARQLAAIGLDATSVLSGPVPMTAVLTERRNGQGELAVSANLTSAALSFAPLAWQKARDVPAAGSVRVRMNHDHLTGIDDVQLDGPGLSLRGRAVVSGGKVVQLQADRLALGRSSMQGTVRFPEIAGRGPIMANLRGATIDLGPRLAQRTPHRRETTESPPGPPWSLDASFDRVLMANDSALSNVTVHIEDDGRVIRQMRVDGRTGATAPFAVQIAPDAGGRRLTMNAHDAGELLRDLDYLRSMQGGTLTVQAHYDDAQPGRPLSGTADIEDFRIRKAPVLAKLLQAMTLYGLVQLMQGPGLGFSRLVAPFRIADDTLELSDARAFSPSLGLTAKGQFDLDAEHVNMQGTIVPAYFFNALLGNVPLVGRLFSPERGGGVFAASYTVRGPLADPDVFINPLTALTPGFLRGVFGLF
jgi:hypothetical protein